MRIFAWWTVLAALVAACGCGDSSPQHVLALPAIFSDHAVLQQETILPVWGWDEPGQEVTVVLAGQRRITQAGPGGKWLVKFDPLPAGGPHTLTVYGSGRLDRQDLLVGDVWICAGGEGMALPMREIPDAARHVQQAAWPKIRLFTVPRATANVTQWDTQSFWKYCSPENAADFSAVGYFLAKDLHNALQIPVGVIDASWANSQIQSWLPRSALRGSGEHAARLAALDHWARAYRTEPQDRRQVHQDLMVEYRRNMEAYVGAIDRRDPGLAGKWSEPKNQDRDWARMSLPGPWETRGLPGLNGVVWFRKRVEVPESWAGKDLSLRLGRIDRFDAAYFNGEKVGAVDYRGDTDPDDARVYTVPGSLVRSGQNVIAVRVTDLGGPGGWIDPADRLSLSLDDGGQDAIDLRGPWRYRVAVRIDGSDAPVRPEKDAHPAGHADEPAGVYNGMIAPLVPYAIAGVSWYQGRSDVKDPDAYARLLGLLIRGWRHEWKQTGDFHWGLVQLPALPEISPPYRQYLPWMRQAQFDAADILRKTGLIVSFDTSGPDRKDTDRQMLGRRLALWALAKVHSRDVVGSGPTYLSHQPGKGRLRLQFKNVNGGLAPRVGRLKGFTIAGDDRKFHPAQARIEEQTVVVWSQEVAEPQAVRYGWAPDPDGANLYNRFGLPASPFRTDDWPAEPGQ